ncbi:MAG: DNA polymerase III subunit delta [Magnetococcales bacterium]|nr:DNA polymerase III subunit delta [Magnetococcales bacterium]
MKLKSTALAARLRAEGYPPVLLLYGSEQGQIADQAAALHQQLFSVEPADADFDTETFHARDLSAERFLAACRAIPLGAARRLVTVREADGLPQAQGAVVLDYLKAPNPSTLLLLLAGPLEARSKLRAAAERSANGWCVPFYPLEGPAFQQWVGQWLAAAGLAVDRDALVHLAQRLEGDTQAARPELEKLALYLGAQRRVDLEAVLAVVGETVDHSAFALAETITAGQVPRALHILERLLERGEEPLTLLGSLLPRIRRLAQARDGLDQGEDPKQILERLKIFWKDQAPLMQQARRIPARRLADALLACQEADAALKGAGRLPPELVMERLVLRLALWFRGDGRG